MSENKSYRFTNNWFENNAGFYWKNLNKYLQGNFDEPLNCLDVGTWEGRSAVWMAENLVDSKGTLHVVDLFINEQAKSNFFHNMDQTGIRDRISIYEGDAVLEMPKLLESHLEYFHFIYLDAGKSASTNCLCALIGERMLVKGGIMVVDDYLWRQVKGRGLRETPKLGIDFYSIMSSLTEMRPTPRTQAVFVKRALNSSLNSFEDSFYSFEESSPK